MTTRNSVRFLAAFFLLAVLLASAPAASAQCAMCANAAATQQAEARKALNIGIAALVMPTLLLIGGFVFLSYSRRNPPDDPTGEPPELRAPEPAKPQAVNLPLDSSSDPPRPSA